MSKKGLRNFLMVPKFLKDKKFRKRTFKSEDFNREISEVDKVIAEEEAFQNRAIILKQFKYISENPDKI